VTIFLTTQYLEEADQLAERVSIITAGRIAAEGTPEELKRSIGRDVVIVTGDGPMELAHQAVAALPDVERVDRSGRELTLAVSDGPAAVPAIATRLAALDGFALREISLRRPTLDDVFLQVTGSRIESEISGGTETAGTRVEAA
jgi:ABC-2 type transport system ATP-binding protein